MAQKTDYAICLRVDGYMIAYNPELGNITIRFKGDNVSDVEDSLRGDLVEFYTIKHRAQKRPVDDENACYIVGSDKAQTEYMFVCNHDLNKRRAEYAAKIQEFKKSLGR